MRHPNIINIQELESTKQQHGESYLLHRKQLGAKTRGDKLGCSWIELPPGKKSWPMHYHCVNEESIYILEGEGTLRIGEEKVAVRAGDYISFRAGKDDAHQMINTSSAPLRYLCISTMEPNEIAVYPDSNKVFVCAGSAPGGAKEKRILTSVFRSGDTVDYWDGE
jgi:uncharacterized cupin superfamily protein